MDGQFQCPACDEILNNIGEFTDHIRTHNLPGNVCGLCAKQLSSASSLDRHMYVHSRERPFKCGICSTRFTTNGNLHRHSRSVHKDESSVEQKAKISGSNHVVLNKSTMDDQTISNSIFNTDSIDQFINSSISNLIHQNISNFISTQTENSTGNLDENNLNNLNQQGVFKSNEFVSAKSLKRNLEEDCHKKSKLMKIDVNGSSKENEYVANSSANNLFDLFNGIISSNQESETSNTVFVDPYDPISYILLENKTGSKKKFHCKICNLTVNSVKTLKRHQTIHQTGGKIYNCDNCPFDYSTLNKSGLERHQRRHNGKRPYECTICKYPFTTKSNCERHVRKRHQIQNPSLACVEIKVDSANSNETEDLSKKQENNHELYQPSNEETVCRFCKKDFKFNRLLRQHIRTSSLNESNNQLKRSFSMNDIASPSNYSNQSFNQSMSNESFNQLSLINQSPVSEFTPLDLNMNNEALLLLLKNLDQLANNSAINNS